MEGPRGDSTTTVSLTAGKTAAGVDSWAGYTEYGTPEAGTASTQSITTGVTDAGYGWLGKFERSSLEALGITLMGARLYNQTTGLFTSLDPQYQGGDTWYGYPTDPINKTDLNGQWWQIVVRIGILFAIQHRKSIGNVEGRYCETRPHGHYIHKTIL